jgi:hypothetical protein
MATASIAHSTGAKKPKKPDAGRIYQAYLYHCKQTGQRTAASLTAQSLGVSDDTVRRVVKRFEQPSDPTPDDLLFTPPPGAEHMEAERIRRAPEFAADAAAKLGSIPGAEPQEHPQPDEPMSGETYVKLEWDSGDVADDEPQPDEPQTRTAELAQTAAGAPEVPQRIATLDALAWPTIAATPSRRVAQPVKRLGRIQRLDVARVADVAWYMIGPLPLGALLFIGVMLALYLAPGPVLGLLCVAVLIALCLAKVTAR